MNLKNHTQETPAAQEPSTGSPSLNVSLWAVRGLFFLNGMLFASWATRIPAVQQQFDLSNGALGLALMIMALGAVIAMPTAGWLCARFESRHVVLGSAAIYLLGLPLIALMWDFPSLVVALLTFGIGHGMLDVAMNVQAVELERQINKPINSSIHALWSLGGLSGAIFGGVIAVSGVSPLGHFVTIVTLLAFALWPILSRLPRASATPHDAIENTSLGLEATLDQGVHAEFHVDETKASGETSGAVNGRSAAILLTSLLGIMAFCVMAGEGAMADWSAVLLSQVLGASEGIAAMGYAAFAIAMASGRFAGDALSAKLGPRNQVRASAALALVGVLMVVTSFSTIVALIGFVFIGLGFATIVPAVFTACGRLPGLSPSIALASVSTIGYFGFLLGPPLIGFAAELVNLRVALGSLVLTTSATIALASILSKQQFKEDDEASVCEQSEPLRQAPRHAFECSEVNAA